MVLLKLLQTWGLKGFLEHAESTASFYRERRDVLARCLERHLLLNPHENGDLERLAEWKVPDASMFFWLKLNLQKLQPSDPAPPTDHGPNPRFDEGKEEQEDEDSTTFIRETAVPRGVLVLPGKAAFPDGRETLHVRLSFSLLSDEEMEEAVKRLAGAIVEQQGRPRPHASRRKLLQDTRPTRREREVKLGEAINMDDEKGLKGEEKSASRTTAGMESEKPLPALPQGIPGHSNVSGMSRTTLRNNIFRRVASIASFSIFTRTTPSTFQNSDKASALKLERTSVAKFHDLSGSIKARTSMLRTKFSMNSLPVSRSGASTNSDRRKGGCYCDDVDVSQETTQTGITTSDEVGSLPSSISSESSRSA